MQLSDREDFADFLQTGFVEKRATASKGRPFGGARRVQKLPFGALSHERRAAARARPR